MKTRLYSFLKLLIGFPLTLLALFFILKIIISQTPLIVSNLHSIQVSMLILGIFCFIAFYFLRSYIWFLILKYFDYRLAFRESNYLWAISEIKRYIPGNIWSFLGRTVIFQQKGVKKKDIAKGIIFEAEIFIIGSVIISLLTLPYFFTEDQTYISLLITIVVIGLSVLYCLNKSIPIKLKGKGQKIISFLFPPFSVYENVYLLFVSIIALFIFGLGNYFVIGSVIYLTPKLFLDLIGIFDLAFIIGYLSFITPAGFGVREAVIIYSLTKIVSSGIAAFGALFSRIVLIFSELLFILLCTGWYKIKNMQSNRLQKSITAHPQVSIVTLLVGIYMLYFDVVSFFRYDNFYTGRFDLGNMAQTVWNTLHGRIFLFTNPNGTAEISRLAFHADFILILLAPFYALWQNPKNLLFIQTLIVAIGAYYVYIIARDILKNRNIGLAFAFMFLINPSVERANIYDFHAITLATTFFFATYYYFLKKKYKLFLLFALLAALCKEEIWLIVALFGLPLFFWHKKRVFGALLFIFCAAMFYFLFWIAIPKTLGSQHFALVYLSDFGDSPTKVVKSILLSPNKIIQTVLEPSRLGYLNQLSLPVGYLFIFFPFFLIFAGPDLLIDLLSNNPQLHQIYYQYTATITPFIFLSAIYGCYWLYKLIISRLNFSVQKWNMLVIIYLIVFSLYGAYDFGPLPGARDPNLDMFIKQLPDRNYVDSFLEKIPKKDSVAASNDIGSHLSSRENIYEIPYGLDRADIVVLLLDGTDPQAKGVFVKVSKDPHYEEIARKDDFVAFQRK
jgi:uncharacterized membrane protein/uncharacterized membrane protein YbhN (UPF0104 family)